MKIKLAQYQLLLALGLSLIWSIPGISQNSVLVDFPVLSLAYEVNKDPIDYIIVIDQSISVRPFWEPIKSSVARLVNIAHDGDYMSFIGFKEGADNLIIPRSITPASRQAIIGEIRALGIPMGLKTDLYASIDYTLEAVNRSEGRKLQLIFYFTDFIKDPPAASRWRNASPDVLVNKRKNYIDKSGKLIKVFAFQLPLEAGAGVHFPDFSTIFDNRVIRIISDLNTMQEWFGRLSKEISREKLKLSLQDDLVSFLTIKEIHPQGDHVSIKVENKLKIPVVLESINFQSSKPAIQINQTLKNVTIQALGTTTVNASLQSFLNKETVFLEKKITIPNSVISFNCSFKPLESEFGRLNIPTEQHQQISTESELIFKTGTPYWIIVVAIALLILIFYLINKTWLKSEWIFNKKPSKMTVALDGNLLNNSTKFFEKSKRAIVVDHTFINPMDISPDKLKIIADAKFKIFLIAAKPGFLTLKPKRGTYLFAEQYAGVLRMKKLIRGKTTFVLIPSNQRLFSEPVFLHKGISIVGEFNSGITKTKLEINFYNK